MRSSGPAAGVTVIAGPSPTAVSGPPRCPPTTPSWSRTTRPNAGTWLLWDGRRSAIDLTNRAVTDALGMGVDLPAPRPIAPGLFNAIPEAPALTAPAIPGASEPPRFPLPLSAPVGAVVAAFDAANAIRYYAVLSDGLQPISPVLAAILRNTNSFGLDQPPRLSADEVARMPVARGIDTAVYPSEPVTLVNAGDDPVTCARWAKPEGATGSSLTLLSGAALPLPDGIRTVDLVTSGIGRRSQPGGATRRQRLLRRERRLTVLGERHRRPLRHRYGGRRQNRCRPWSHPPATADPMGGADAVRGGPDPVPRRRAACARRPTTRPEARGA